MGIKNWEILLTFSPNTRIHGNKNGKGDSFLLPSGKGNENADIPVSEFGRPIMTIDQS